MEIVKLHSNLIKPNLPASKTKLFTIPQDDEFEDKSFMVAPALEAVGSLLIYENSKFSFLKGVDILYCWKRDGGKSNNKIVLGKIGKINPRERFLCDDKYQFLMWIAADHTRQGQFTEFQMEALVFHELCHLGKMANGEIVLLAHDFEGFAAELEAYGLWKSDLRQLGFLQQGKLF